MKAYVTEHGIQAECPRTKTAFIAGDIRLLKRERTSAPAGAWAWLLCGCCRPNGARLCDAYDANWHPYELERG
jgi:hypothetical protein